MKITALQKTLLAGIICLLVQLPVKAQSNEDNPYASLPFKKRLFYGGDLGLSFGSVTYIRVAPLVGYNVSPKLAVGVSPSYEYYSDNRYSPKYTSTMYGGSAFARYFVLPSIFIQASPEVLNLEALPTINLTTGEYVFSDNRVTIPILLLGAGFSQRTANGSGFFISILYDVIQDINSPYPNNIVFRLGGMIAF